MAVDQIKKLQAAEDLLKQGRSDEALAELQRLAEASPNDLLTLNRMGDMLSRQGRVEDALGYYREIADKFASAGYLHKAVAILKKMLRLDAESTDVLAMIGRLYIRQKLPVEGGRYLLSAADRFLEAKDFANARSVYEELVVTDPQNPLHRARLAETLAAEGDGEAAGRELVRLADSLRSEGRWEDAERSYRRAGELCAEWHDPILGVSACLNEQGKKDEALAILEEAVSNGRRALLGELILRSEMAQRHERVDELLAKSALQIAPETFEHLFRYSKSANETTSLWTRLDPVFATWPAAGAMDRLVELYENLVGIEDGGHVPAMERLFAVLEGSQDRAAFVPAMERLSRGLRQKAMNDRAESVLGWLRATAPQSPVVRAATSAAAPAAAAAAAGTNAPPLGAEAPAVPRNRSDMDFVTGRLTQAEILEKYSLVDQAVQQVRGVVSRFPGHVDGQKRLVKLLRQSGDMAGHAEALAGLAIACRAEGNVQAARNSAQEAIASDRLDAGTAATLKSLGLIGAAAQQPVAKPAKSAAAAEAAAVPSKPAKPPAAKKAAQPAAAKKAAPPPQPVAPPQAAGAVIELSDVAAETPIEQTSAAPAPQPAVAKTPSDDTEIVLDLDGDDDGVLIDLDADDTPAVAPTAIVEPVVAPQNVVPQVVAPESVAPQAVAPESVTEPSGAKEPGGEMLEEVEFYLGQDRVEEARKRIDTMVELGYSSPRLEELAVIVAKQEAELSALPAGMALDDQQPEVVEAEDDLSTIAAALEGELEVEIGPVEPDAGTEQSVDDVFAAFRERVNEEVGSEDHRTHYDLGIGYKEMGLLEEALCEFEVSVKSPELRHESHVMMGMIQRELGRIDEALASYQTAAAASTAADSVALRYELAELLQETGDIQTALQVLREVLAVDPTFRDVQDRISHLESAQPA